MGDWDENSKMGLNGLLQGPDGLRAFKASTEHLLEPTALPCSGHLPPRVKLKGAEGGKV